MNRAINLLARVISRFDAMVILPIESHQVTKGQAFSVRKRYQLAAESSLDIVFDATALTLPKKLFFLPISFNAIGGTIYVDIYNGVIENGDGNILTDYNRNFRLGTPPQSVVRDSPTGVDISGLDAIEILIPSDGVGASSTSSSDTGDPLPVELDKDKKLLIRLTNISLNGIAEIGVKLDFFEVTI